jgi:hypothetical protein
MNLRQTTINNYVIFAVGSLTVKHRTVDIAMKNIPVAAERCLPAKTVRRDTVTLAAPPSASEGRHASAAEVIKE